VIPSADLRAEVLERIRELGPGRSWTAFEIAHHGEPRSVPAVWSALLDLWETGVLEQPTERGFRPAVEYVAPNEQIALDVERGV